MSAWVRAILAALAIGGVACASAPPPAAPSSQPVRVRVEMLGGFSSAREPLPPARVALVLDATASMARSAAGGPSRVRGARAAAQRFIKLLPEETPLSLWITGNARAAKCDDPLTPHEGDRAELARITGQVRARGKGSLAVTLDALPGPREGGFERVVAVSALDDGCDADLCAAAEGLAARGVRLDLVRIGDAPMPDCLVNMRRAEPADAPVPWETAIPARFHVERSGADPAILVCGETGGLPVELAAGRVDVVVALDPPLRVSRDLPPGTRWRLEVLDFPTLDPPERQWRWRPEAVPASEAEAVQ